MSVIFLRILLSIKVLQEVTVEIFIPEILSSVSIAAISMRIKFLLEKREQVLPPFDWEANKRGNECIEGNAELVKSMYSFLKAEYPQSVHLGNVGQWRFI